jgi:NAD(P)H-dependent glutamate synthase small subunit
VAKPTGFQEYQRQTAPKRAVRERIIDWNEIEKTPEGSHVETQASRCMDCGIPFCHSFGCPLKNRIPDFNDLVYRRQWRKAVALLHSTNNFPEFTGRVCPALCEESCTLAVGKSPVTIRQIEMALVEKGFDEGWIHAEPAVFRTGKKIVVIGSGPAGLAAAQELSRAGHDVTVVDEAERPGGLLRYGIPDFKLDKKIIDRRLEQMREEGVRFETGVKAGEDLSAKYLRRTYDAIVIATGSREPRNLDVPGRDLSGVHYALDYLTAQNLRNHGSKPGEGLDFTAKGLNVVVVGGGDTGSDCIGTARRQGALDVTQIELLPEPPKERTSDNPWPHWPKTLRTSTSHDEGCTRMWNILTKSFDGDGGRLTGLTCVKIEWFEKDGKYAFRETPGSEFKLKADLAFLATGFVHPRHDRLITELGVALDKAGNIAVTGWQTSVPGVFAAGDCARGASLVVHAINAGRLCASAVSSFLKA